jgi:hypothetical protein
MLIRLTRKLAECVDGIDLSRSREGDVLELSRRDAGLLVAEGWAESFDSPPRTDVVGQSTGASSADGPDSAARLTTDQLRRVREQMEHRMFEQQEERRAEDRIREELHDARARTVSSSDRDEPF